MNRIPRREVEDFTDRDLQEIYAQVEELDVVGIDAFKDEFLASIEVQSEASGTPLPFPNTEDKLRLRETEVSVWAGINGHKKSTLLSQILVHAAKRHPVGLASFEMRLQDTAKMMCKQAAAVDVVAKEFAEDFISWSRDRIWWYRALGSVTPLQALGCVSAMAKRGVKLIALDNLQFMGVTDDPERERLFFNQLIGLAEALKVHIAIVHHTRKPQQGGDEYVPTRFDVRGGSTITDQAHLLIITWHNKIRAMAKRKMNDGIPLTEREAAEMSDGVDQRLIVAKQRHHHWEGTIALFEGPGQTFKRSESANSIRVDIPRSQR
jgi:twinkle protein